MDFYARAQNALERESPARAMILLVQGLRRAPEREDALDLLLFIYTTQILNPGLESDLLKALAPQQSGPALLRFTLDELSRLEKAEMVRALTVIAEEQGFEIGEALPEPGPEVEVEVEVADEESVDAQEARSDDELVVEERDEAHEEDEELRERSEERGRSEERVPKRTRRERGEKKNRGRRRLVALVLGLVFLVALISGAFFAWQQARLASQTAAMDEIMRELDPLAPERAYQRLEQVSLSPGGRREAAIFERRQFIRALVGLEGGPAAQEVVELVYDEVRTPWGAAALALAAAQEQRWEEAMRFVHFLEQAHGDSLPAFFAQGRICEARRDWECAQAQYSRIQQRFEEFLPARMGAMRVAAYRFDGQRWEQEQEGLSRRRAEHPYATLPWVDPFGGVNGAVEGGDELLEEEFEDRFLRAWSGVVRAWSELVGGELDEAQETCQAAIEGAAMVLPAAYLLCAISAAQRGDARGSRDYFMALAMEEGLMRGFYRRLQAMAPPVLVDLGRADWGLALTIPLRGAGESGAEGKTDGFVSNREAARPAHFLPPRAVDEEGSSGRAGQALFVRGESLLALGAVSEARATAKVLSNYPGYEGNAWYLRGRASLIAGELERAERESARIEDGALQAELLARIFLVKGEAGKAKGVLEGAVGSRSAASLRLRALAYLSEGRGREALGLLDSAPDELEYLALRAVRWRALARTAQEVEPGPEELAEILEGMSLEYLIDQGAGALWRRDFETARALLERALTLASEDGEANWLMGLVLRVEGQMGQARQHFRRGFRGDEDSGEFLLELGHVLLERGDIERAREVFLRVTLREKQNIEAVAGLGRSYYRGDQLRGQRDLKEVLGKYRGTDRDAAARAEIYRWLAILYGSREGAEESFIYLEKAKEIIGERAELLIEEGRYWVAREEWEEARQGFSRALQINPTLSEPHLGLARVAEAAGDLEAARGHLWRASELSSQERWRLEAEEELARLEEQEE